MEDYEQKSLKERIAEINEVNLGEDNIKSGDEPSKQPRRSFSKVVIACGLIAMLCAGLLGGFFVGRDVNLRQDKATCLTVSQGKNGGSIGMSFADNDATRQSINQLGSVYRMLKDNYYRELSDSEIIQAMTKGASNYLDSPHTFYLTADSVQSMRTDMAGKYSGIGAAVSQNAKSKLYEIAEVFDNSPASNAGLRQGDIIQSVDGKDVRKYSDATELSTIVRGKDGTKVTLTVYRESDKKVLNITITRGTVVQVNVISKIIENNVGYVRVTKFSDGVAAEFAKALETLSKQGAKSYVIDLRSNSGGRADECTSMLDLFLPKGTLLSYIEGRNNGKPETERWIAKKGVSVNEKAKVAVIVNRYSASASELFSGSLRDHNRAVIVGEQTFGKGTGTRQFDLNEGAAVQVTMFRYFLPKGECVEGKGLQPNVEVKISPDAEAIPMNQRTVANDEQLKAAVEKVKD